MSPTLLERPTPTWRYIVQRASTREILTRQANLKTDDETYALSASGSATFTTTPVIAEQVAADGLPMFGKFRTLIAAEADGQIRWRGIVTDIETTGPSRTITVDSLSTIPHDIPYLGEPYYGAQVDPADVMRLVWAHVQSFRVPASDLGITVVGSTPLRIGTYSTQNKTDTAAAYAAAVSAYDTALAARRAAQAAETAARGVYSQRVAAVTSASDALSKAKAIRPRNQAAIDTATGVWQQAVRDRDAQGVVVDGLADKKKAAAAVVDDREVTKSRTYAAKVAASKAVKDDGGAITLLPWEAPDCGEFMDSLATDNGFEWIERHRWNDDESDIVSEIVIGYPRVGSRRTDLVFEQGVNMTIVPTVSDSGDDYANTHVLIGAGEGAGAIRRETSVDDGAIRRVQVVSAKDVKTTQVADKRLRAIAPTSLVTEQVTSITVVDHVLAPIGSWTVGDDIRVDFRSSAQQQDKKLWHRITSWTRTGPRTATLTLKRSSAYTYGG